MNSNQQHPDHPSLLLSVARVAAVVMAIGVVSYLVWDAQEEAQPEQVPVVPAAGGALAEQQSEPSDQDAVLEVLMPSSKRGVLMPSSKFAPLDFFAPAGTNQNGVEAKSAVDGQEVLLSGSKSGLLPSSKVIVLPSSKSGRPTRLDMDQPEVKKLLEAIEKEKAAKKQANDPSQGVKR